MFRSAYSFVVGLGLLASATIAHAGGRIDLPLGTVVPAEAGGALLAIAVAGVIAGIYIKRRKR